MLKKKDGERNLHVPSCTPDVQAALRETRRIEWNKWMQFNAGGILTDEEVRRLTEAGCEIYPMSLVDTDKKTRIYEEIMMTFLFLQSAGVDWLVAETSGRQTDFAQILQLVMWIRTMLFGWCAQAHVLTHSCDYTKGHFQGQEIDRILLYRIPAEGIPEEGIPGGAIWASRVPVYGTKDAGRGLWLRLKNTCKHFKFSLTQILPTLFALRDDESRIIAVMSSNVDDLCMAISRKELQP